MPSSLTVEELLKLSPKEMLKHSAKPNADGLREKKQVHYEDVNEGMEFPKYIIGPVSTTQFFRWSAAIENWHRIHYDIEFASNHDKLPHVLGQGSWKQSAMPSYLKDLTLPNGWFWKLAFQNRAMIVPGDILIFWAKVTKKYEKGGFGFVELETGLKNQDNIETMPGTATIVLPKRGGAAVPYPFVPPKD